ncbi:MAG: hypothetical protein DSM106950_00185 [Stigonema ocellatum SAG 48.90 = DSM 106950]|nr:hypothetical protein [Stigonema ocellatum SAG 48.90 = DSM 106950]
MTNTNANNLEVLFHDLSQEETACISGGESVVTFANADASFTNNTGGIALTSAITKALDQGTHTGSSKSSSLSVAYNDTNNAPRVGGNGQALNLDQFVNGLLAP